MAAEANHPFLYRLGEPVWHARWGQRVVTGFLFRHDDFLYTLDPPLTQGDIHLDTGWYAFPFFLHQPGRLKLRANTTWIH